MKVDEFLAEFNAKPILQKEPGTAPGIFCLKKNPPFGLEGGVGAGPGIVAVCWFVGWFFAFCRYFFVKTWDPGWQTKDAWKRLCFSKKKT